MTQIKSPNKEYDGVSLGVQFSQGVGETDDAKKIEWFQEHGYTVENGSAAPTSSAIQDSEFASEISNSAQESTEGFSNYAASQDAVNAFSSNAANETEFASEAGTSNFQESSDSESHGHSKKHKR